MVDNNDVYLDIKLNYKNVIKEINSKDLLTIEEIKTKIKELFGLKKCKLEDLDLLYSKNNNKIINEDDLIFLSDEISEYQYVIEIKVENKSDLKKDEIEKLKRENEEKKERKKQLYILKEKEKINIEINKKKMKIKKEIQKQIYIKNLKNKVSKECLKSLKDNLVINSKQLLSDINEKNKEQINLKINQILNDMKTKLYDGKLYDGVNIKLKNPLKNKENI